MAYNPQLHTDSNKSYGMGQPGPTDARSYFYDEVNFYYRPYYTKQEVIDYLTLTYRTGHFSVFIQPSPQSTSDPVTEYWFKDGIDDINDLVLKGVAATPTWQQTLIAGTNLTQDNTINGLGRDLQFNVGIAMLILNTQGAVLGAGQSLLNLTNQMNTSLLLKADSGVNHFTGKFDSGELKLEKFNDSDAANPIRSQILFSASMNFGNSGLHLLHGSPPDGRKVELVADAANPEAIMLKVSDGTLPNTNKLVFNDTDDVVLDIHNGATLVTTNVAGMVLQHGSLNIYQASGSGIAVHGVFIPEPVNPGHVVSIKIDQPGMRISMENGNTDNEGGGGIRRPSENFGELRIFSGNADYGTAPAVAQSSITFYVGPSAGTQAMNINTAGIVTMQEGFVLPRLTTAERDAITTAGAMCYNTQTNQFNARDNTGWKIMTLT